jgi:cell division topological specificity factor
MLLRFCRSRRSAPVARERLKMLLAHERISTGKSDLISILHEEILAVIRKHVTVDPQKVKVSADRDDKVSTLTVDIEIPLDTPTAAAA